jgi:serine/threonine protein kinase
VKKLYNDKPGFDDEQFKNEFDNLMRLKHPNIVRLVGYCFEIKHEYMKCKGVFGEEIHRALCFEYLSGGSLDNHIYGMLFL